MEYSYLLLKGTAHVIHEDEKGVIPCPVCSHWDVAMWADDGEADLADWWKCETFSGGCGATGAVVMDPDHSVTQNGKKVVGD
jgi:hypothetical protein